jgi:hypothetical protein
VRVWLHEPFLSAIHPETLGDVCAASCGSATTCKDRDLRFSRILSGNPS